MFIAVARLGFAAGFPEMHSAHRIFAPQTKPALDPHPRRVGIALCSASLCALAASDGRGCTRIHAGEQRNRRYDWGKLDRAAHAFGTPADAHSGNTIRCLLGPDRPAEVGRSPPIRRRGQIRCCCQCKDLSTLSVTIMRCSDAVNILGRMHLASWPST